MTRKYTRRKTPAITAPEPRVKRKYTRRAPTPIADLQSGKRVKQSGGPRGGAGRKPIEAHFALLNAKLDQKIDALAAALDGIVNVLQSLVDSTMRVAESSAQKSPTKLVTPSRLPFESHMKLVPNLGQTMPVVTAAPPVPLHQQVPQVRQPVEQLPPELQNQPQQYQQNVQMQPQQVGYPPSNFYVGVAPLPQHQPVAQTTQAMFEQHLNNEK